MRLSEQLYGRTGVAAG